MSFEFNVFGYVIGFSLSIFREEEPQELESSILYKLINNDETGEVIKVPYWKPLV